MTPNTNNLTLDQMTRDMEEHLGIDCLEYKGLSQAQRLTIILFEVCRHIPKHTGEKKGNVEKNSGILQIPTSRR